MFKQLKNRLLENRVFRQRKYYFDEKNDLSFIFSSHAIAAFFILPFFAIFLLQKELPEVARNEIINFLFNYTNR